jgi:hypothetical protein
MRVSSLLVWGRTPPSVRPGNARRRAPHALRRITTHVALLLFLFAVPSSRAANCIPIHQAGQHIGETRCVTGKVFTVKAVPKASISWISVKMLWPVLSPSWSKRPERCRRRPPPSRTHHRDPRSPEGLRRPPRNHPQPHQPDRGRRRHHPSATQELRCGKPWPLQCRSIASNKKAHEDEGQAEHHRDLWQ